MGGGAWPFDHAPTPHKTLSVSYVSCLPDSSRSTLSTPGSIHTPRRVVLHLLHLGRTAITVSHLSSAA